jgi:hypothetical protein
LRRFYWVVGKKTRPGPTAMSILFEAAFGKFCCWLAIKY